MSEELQTQLESVFTEEQVKVLKNFRGPKGEQGEQGPRGPSGFGNDHVNDVNNPHFVTKEQIGLGKVNNTADEDKPLSKAARVALAGKVNKTDIEEIVLNILKNLPNN